MSMHPGPTFPRTFPRFHPSLLGTLSAAALLGLTPAASFSNEQQAHLCRFCSSGAAPTTVESASYRKYAPDRTVDILHLALDVTPDFQQRTIKGSVTIRFKPLSTPLGELRLDSVDLNIGATSSSEAGFKHQVTESEIVFNFSPPIPVGKESTVTVHYRAEPVKGLYFRTKEMGYSETTLWTQGESIESRHWFPCFDHPIEKFTSEVTCHLPAGMVALSNGRQTSVTKDPDGLTAFRWHQEKPHVNYLITLVAGQLAKIEEKHGDIPLEFWTAPSDLPYAPNSFRNTRLMMEMFEREIGVPYPWSKYGQVTVKDYHWGGMENTSLTTLNANTLFSVETENLTTSDGLVAHELAHQWFGDLLTCKDWSHIWLNEGFATYYSWLWDESFSGRNEFLSDLHSAAKGILSNTNETRGIVWRKFNEPGEMFNYLAYPKGAWVLHMLRSQLGPELYRKCIQTYVERHAYGSVTTENLRAVFEEISGRTWDRFFDQWVYGSGAPTLDVAYSWDEKTSLAKLTVKQTQKISEDAYLFQFPLTFRFGSKTGPIDRTVQVTTKEEDFYFPLKTAPETVRIDPELTVLAKVNFKPARPMLFKQLADNTDIIGQLVALDGLADKPDKEAVGKIRITLQDAAYYGVRARAAEVLKGARSDEALAALLASVNQPDARVRNAVVSAIGGFYNNTALNSLQETLRQERNPAIVATALRALGPYSTPEVRETLVGFLQHPSFRERLTEAAVSAIKTQDDPAFATPLLETLQKRAGKLPAATIASALDTLGTLQRNEPNKDAVRALLLTQLQEPRERVRLAAITGLGNLEDTRSIATLETFAKAAANRPEKAVAEKALEKIRGARKPSEELKGLRTEISELQKSGRDLKKDLETLQKKLEPKP
jgi:aminopeptidase N